MKAIIGYIRQFVKEHFNLRLYLAFIIFTAALVFINYRFNFENSIIDADYGKSIRMLWYALIHAVAYYGVLIISVFTTGRKDFLFDYRFWLKSLIGFAILGIDRSFHYHTGMLQSLMGEDVSFLRKMAGNMKSIFTIGLLLFIVYLIFDRKSHFGFYGLRFKKVDFRPYVVMVLLLVPLTFAASFLPDFIDFYPVYKRAGGPAFADMMQWSEWFSKIVFEFFYALDFISVELFFRGFLVIGLMRYLGKDAILPMAATYCALHFGKPLGEAISSVFGGYILGIIALYSRNIWGGIFVHVGIALSMELFAFMQLGYLR